MNTNPSPVQVPLLLGMMRLHDYPELATPQTLLAFIERCVERGLHAFDHANIYGLGSCEARFGDALRLRPQLRGQLQLISKADIVLAPQDVSRWQVKHYDSSAAHLRDSLDASLKRLGVERLDGFLLHRPDPLMQAEETIRVLQDMLDSGKVGWLGVSNFLPLQWQQLARELPLRCNQIELSLLAQDAAWDGQLQALQGAGLQALAWSPFAGGAFPVALQQALETVADTLGATADQVALAWLRRLPGEPVPIIGSLRWSRIENALAGAQLHLDAPTWFHLAQVARGHEAP
nr:aldo/keto reductase [uncultured Pseudomonas sp.]